MGSTLQKNKDYYSGIRNEMLEFVPRYSKTILEIGCGEGNFGAYIKNSINAEVWGIELDQKSASMAKSKLDKVINGDINLLLSEMPDNYFDCIVFNDVLEHLADPYSLLKNIKCKLSNNGIIVASIPNVRFINVIRSYLVKKDWEYCESGILDYTHLRFFTQKSITKMFTDLDYETINIKGINRTFSLTYYIWNILSFGLLSDSKYRQFACVAKPAY